MSIPIFNKILSAPQTKLADKHTIDCGISPINLMEKAALAFMGELLKHTKPTDVFYIFCGMGNNGGDGFAIALLLENLGYEVKVFWIKTSENASKDCETNALRVKKYSTVNTPKEIPQISQNVIVIDAIFGTGLSKKVENLAQKVINKINESGTRVFSVDVPSGLMCDLPTEGNAIVKADITITFQRPKLAFFLPEFGNYANHWVCVDIGLDESFIQSQNSDFYYLDERIKALLKPRQKFSHKGDYGHALLMAGSYGKMGAALIAAEACLDFGVGLLTAQVPKCGYEIMQTAQPKAMCIVDKSEHYLTELQDIDTFDVISVGPGIGTQKKTAEMLQKFLEEVKHPMVLDADALNIIAENKWQDKIPQQSIITPHPKEFERLFGKSENSFERLELQRTKSKAHKIIIVLKGSHTSVSDAGGNIYFNTTGGAWLAQGGSGDRLTGIITAFLAQKHSPLEAALLGVYLHGIKD